MGTKLLAVAQTAEPGGAEHALLRAVPLLAARGFDVELTAPGDGGVISGARRLGIPVHSLELGSLRQGAWPRAAVSFPRAKKLMQQVRPDIVLLNGTVAQRIAPAFAGIPQVLGLHDILEVAPRLWSSSRFWRSLGMVVCACEAIREAAIRVGAPSDRLVTVYPPVETVEPVPRPEWARGAGPVVGYVGRVEPMKGTLDLLGAARELRDRYPDLRVVLAGSNDFGASRRYARKVRDEAAALGDAIVMLGRVEEARRLMRWFDVLAVPSRKESFGTVAAEALAAGTPAVVTRSGGMCEYVRDGRNGAVVDPGDQGALAAAIDSVLTRRAELSEHAREDAGQFSPGHAGDELAGVLRSALDG